MSKQEKLAAFLGEFARWYMSNYNFKDVNAAWKAYANTPDDPPQPPEMPECVAKLLQTFQPVGQALVNAVQAVRDHYRQPLKLEVGKVYEDVEGDKVEIVWKSPGKSRLRWLGVLLITEGAEWYADDGTVCGVPKRSLIREVKQ
jgi:hypothetical protein